MTALPEGGAPRLTVGVVGFGRVGGVLAAALARVGHQVVAVSAISDVSRRRATEVLPGVAVLPPEAVCSLADLVFLTVPDDSLPDLVSGLAATGAVRAGQFIAHTAGRYGIGVLEPATRAGALPLALHPAMSFPGVPGGPLPRLDGVPFGVTAPQQLRAVAEALVVEMGGDPIWVPEESRVLYHAALVAGANHLITLVVRATAIAQSAGIQDPAGLLGPLLHASLDNVLRSGANALTGPVVRGDSGTVAAHVAAIAAADPQALPVYLALARASADLALELGRLAPGRAAELLGILGQGRPFDGGPSGPVDQGPRP